MPNETPWMLDILELSSSEIAKFEIVDIREPDEGGGQLLGSLLRCDVTVLPASKIDPENPPFDRAKQYVLVSQAGDRAAFLAGQLRARGFDNVYAFEGGVQAVRRKYIA